MYINNKNYKKESFLIMTRNVLDFCTQRQECIPVGCVPPAAVAVCWGICLIACWDTPQVWAWNPPTPQPPSQPDAPIFLLSLGLETPHANRTRFWKYYLVPNLLWAVTNKDPRCFMQQGLLWDDNWVIPFWREFKFVKGKSDFITGRNEVLAKVIFLHLSVIHSVHRGVSEIFGGCLKFWGVWNFRGVSEIFGGVSEIFGGYLKFSGGLKFFGGCLKFWGVSEIFGGGCLHRNTVKVRPVRILLECILVLLSFYYLWVVIGPGSFFLPKDSLALDSFDKFDLSSKRKFYSVVIICLIIGTKSLKISVKMHEISYFNQL